MQTVNYNLQEKEGIVKVIVFGDSAVSRGYISSAIESDLGIKILSTSVIIDFENTMKLIDDSKVDVIIIDIEQSDSNIIKFLNILIENRFGLKLLLVSSTIFTDNIYNLVRNLSYNNVEIIEKPLSRVEKVYVDRFNNKLLAKIKYLGYSLRKQKNDMNEDSKNNIVEKESIKKEEDLLNKNYILRKSLVTKAPLALAIASSTGGPKALSKLFSDLEGDLMNVPIFITQHMPAGFTTSLAEHLTKISNKICKEAEEGEAVQPGVIYLAPGDYHMEVKKNENNLITLHINQEPAQNFCRPSADPMLKSLANVYSQQLVLVVLTGMGQDGLIGAQEVAKKNGIVIAQDEATSIVWGMPGAVASNGLCNAILPLDEIASYIMKI